MPLDFPNTPAINDTWTGANGVTYVWDGQKWIVSGSSIGPYLLLAGGTMTGPIALAADPTTDPQAANKHYVDASINLAGNYLGTWAVASNTPNISAGGSISNANYVATTVVAGTPETVPVGVPGIAGMTVANGDRVIWASGLGTWQILRNAGVTLAAADARYYAITNPSGYQTSAQVTAVLPVASSTTPVMDGTATIGVGTTWARADHIHPTDTTRYAASNPSGYQTAANVTTALAPYAPLAAPVFTGDARAVTPTYGDNDTSIATTAFVQAAAAPYANNGGRNLLHNALFNVAQRGAGPWTLAQYYTLDRWVHDFVNGTLSTSQIALADADRAAMGDEAARYALQSVVAGGAPVASYTSLAQYIEDVRRLSGKTVTVSLWARATSGTPKLGLSIDQDFGTGGSPSAWVSGTGQAITLSTTWTRYSRTFAVPSTSGKVLGTDGNHSTLLNIWFSAGTNNAAFAGSIGVQSATFQLWGVQLEIGSVATALDYGGSPQQQLAQCQRFYQALAGLQIGGYAPGAGGLFWASLALPVNMRANPTVVFSGVSYGNASGLTVDSATTTIIAMHAATVAAGAAFATGNVTASADL